MTGLRKWFALAVALLMLVGCSGPSKTGGAQKQPAGPSADGKVFLTFGTSSPGGVYYLLGGAMAQQWEKKIPGSVVAVTTGTSLQQVQDIQSGRKQIGLAQPDTIYFGYEGIEAQGFKKGEKNDQIRMMAAGYVNIMNFIVKADSPIKSLKDLGTRKLAVLSPTTKGDVEDLLKAAGVAQPNVVIITDWNQMAQALRQGSIDMMQNIAAQPNSAVAELGRDIKIRFVPIEPETKAKFLKEHPFYSAITQKKGTYEWQAEDLELVGRGTVVIVRRDLSDDLVYNLTKILYEDVNDLVKVHPLASEFNTKVMQSYLDGNVIRVPFHPGARKYLEEKGVKFPDSLAKG